MLLLRKFRLIFPNFGLRQIFLSDSGKWPFHTPRIHTPTECRPIYEPMLVWTRTLREICEPFVHMNLKGNSYGPTPWRLAFNKDLYGLKTSEKNSEHLPLRDPLRGPLRGRFASQRLSVLLPLFICPFNSEAWGPPQFQEKRSWSEETILGALGEFRGILGAALGIGNSILGIRNSILGMASHDLINTKPTILGATLGAIPGIAANPPERFSFAPAFSERFFKNWGGPRAPDLTLSDFSGVRIPGNQARKVFNNSGNVRDEDSKDSGTFPLHLL